VIDLALWRLRRGIRGPLTPLQRDAILEAARVAVPLLTLLTSARDAGAVIRVAEAIANAGHGDAARAEALLEEVAASYRTKPIA